MIKLDRRVQAIVEDLDNEGAGLARSGEADAPADRFPLHVPLSLPGDRVVATIEHVSRHGAGAWGRLDRVIEPSPDRVEPRCQLYGRCGGCRLEAWRYQSQLDWKRRRVAAALVDQRILDGNAAAARVLACVPSPLVYGYRSFSKLVFGRAREGNVVLGAYAPRSHRLVDMKGCLAVEPVLDETAAHVARLATELRAGLHGDEGGRPGLRYALLRSNHAGQVLVMLVTSGAPGACERTLADELQRCCAFVVGVVGNLNRSPGNVLIGDEEPDSLLAGQPWLEERVGEVRLRLSARSFLQVNRSVAAQLYRQAVEATSPSENERAIDLFTGVGAIAITLARRAGQVVGLERNPAAVVDAQASAALNQVANVRFIVADADAWPHGVAPDAAAGEVLILNPPRKGAASVMEACRRLAPRIVLYVSCSPESLAGDLSRLTAGGYHLEFAQPYDMLPHTPHVETLALLRPR